jgi:hypothetical protein
MCEGGFFEFIPAHDDSAEFERFPATRAVEPAAAQEFRVNAVVGRSWSIGN